MPSKDASDFTPDLEAPTDIAPLGRTGRKPSDDVANWNAIAADPEFKQLLSAKARFILLATIFFIIYYFTLPVLVGWFPDVMERKVIGQVNWAYLFALSQFFMAWILAFLYVGAAAGWDRQAAALVSRFRRRQRI
jgi:uncharacterized membrane protein (DUF485 family)